MLWHKAWLDTRWRFVIGALLLACGTAEVVLIYPRVQAMLPLVPPSGGGRLGAIVRETALLSRDYRGYIWSQGFRQSVANLVTLFAVLLGTGILPQSGGGLFTLSLPVSRARLVGVRAASGLVQLFALALIPAAVVVALSPSVGESYGIGDAAVHAVCLFAAGAVFFSLALLLSSEFGDVWRPLLIALFAAMVLAFFEHATPALSGRGLFSVMTGESYFRARAVPWAGLFVSATLSAAMLYGASAHLAIRDF
jgi:hypothetical protein